MFGSSLEFITSTLKFIKPRLNTVSYRRTLNAPPFLCAGDQFYCEWCCTVGDVLCVVVGVFVACYKDGVGGGIAVFLLAEQGVGVLLN
jgi:hypothetical protein